MFQALNRTTSLPLHMPAIQDNSNTTHSLILSLTMSLSILLLDSVSSNKQRQGIQRAYMCAVTMTVMQTYTHTHARTRTPHTSYLIVCLPWNHTSHCKHSCKFLSPGLANYLYIISMYYVIYTLLRTKCKHTTLTQYATYCYQKNIISSYANPCHCRELWSRHS